MTKIESWLDCYCYFNGKCLLTLFKEKCGLEMKGKCQFEEELRKNLITKKPRRVFCNNSCLNFDPMDYPLCSFEIKLAGQKFYPFCKPDRCKHEWVIVKVFSETRIKKKCKICRRTKTVETKKWQKIREKVLQRDNYTCQKCGSKKKLHVHHIIPLADGGTNELSNLITVCEDCH